MHKFANLIDVQAYDARTATFICSSNYLGYVWQTEPLSFVNEEVERQLKAILQLELPDNSHLSFTLIADDNLTHSFANYQALRQQPVQLEALQKSTAARLQFLRSKQQFSSDINAPCNLRNYILVIALKLGYKGAINQPILLEYQQYASQVQAALEATFGAVVTKRLDARGYLFLMRNLLLSKDYQGIAQLDPIFNYYDPEKTIAQQIFSPSSRLNVYHNCLELNQELVQVFSPLEIPQTFACGQAVNYIGDLLTGITPLTQKFFLTTNLYFANAAGAKAAFERKRTWTIRQSFGPLARFLPRLAQTSENFDIIEDDLNSGDRLVKLSWTLVAWVPPQPFKSATKVQAGSVGYSGDYVVNPDSLAQTSTAATQVTEATFARANGATHGTAQSETTLQEGVVVSAQATSQVTSQVTGDANSQQATTPELVAATQQARSPQLNSVEQHRDCLQQQHQQDYQQQQEHHEQRRRYLEDKLLLKSLEREQEQLAQRLAYAQAFAVKVKSYFQTLGWLLDNETTINLPVFLNALPLCIEHKARNLLERHRTMSTTQATVCLPVFAEWKACSNAVVPLISRTGQLMYLDLFASQTNFNCCIAAQSGSGKSFLVNEMVANLLATGAQCWIIDIGRSYRKLAQVYQGEFIEFSEKAKVNINPFALVQDYVQDSDMLFTLIQAMLSPKDLLTEFQASAIKQLLKNEWDSYGNAMTIDLLEQALRQHPDPRIADLATQLFPFTAQGAYGGYFNDATETMISLLANLEQQQQEQASSKSRLVVLELEELSGRKDLQQLVLLQLIFAINQQMIKGDLSRKKVLFIDEAWDLLAAKTIAHFIETGYRRFRKYNGAVVTITQSLEDLYNSSSGRAIVANSANYYFLAQKTETIQQLMQQQKLVLDRGAVNQITSLRTLKGHYSEIFCMTDAGYGVGRLIVDRTLQLLYSTNAVDIAILNDLMLHHNCDLWQAIALKIATEQQGKHG